MSLTYEMTSFGIDLVKDRKSILNMMSYIFLLHNENSPDFHIPGELQRLIKGLPSYAKNFFTDNIGTALGFLRKSKFTTDEIAGGIGSAVFYFRESKLWKTYQSREFLYFCACYIPKAAKQYYKFNNFQPTIDVYDALIRIIRRNRQKALFNDESWNVLDEISSQIIMVETIHKLELDKIGTSISEIYLLKHETDLIDEREFLLELMKYISSLFFKRVPSMIENLYVRIPKKGNCRFTPSFKKATLLILRNQSSLFKVLEEEGVQQFDQWLARLVMSFHARDFLECCACLSHNHIREYFEGGKLHSPLQAYQSMLYVLVQTTEAGMFTNASWGILEKVSSQIIAEYDNTTDSFDDALLRNDESTSGKHSASTYEDSSANHKTGSQVTLIENITTDEDRNTRSFCICC